MTNFGIQESCELVIRDSTLVNFVRQYNFVKADVYQDGNLVATALRCYIPIEADEIVPVFDEKLNCWVFVDTERNIGYVTTQLPHFGNQSIENYLL